MKLSLSVICAVALGSTSILVNAHQLRAFADLFAPAAPRMWGQASQERQVNETARRLAEFRARLDEYVEVRKKAAAEGPPLTESSDPGAIHAAQAGLASRIRSLRAHARQGDIFTREVRPILRRLLATELEGAAGHDTKAALLEDSPPSVPLKINGRYPASAPLPTVPANILEVLPPLPAELEYRFVQRHLLLFDPEAEIIVDYITNAIR